MPSSLRCHAARGLLCSHLPGVLLVLTGTMLMADAAAAREPMLAHNVFFSLKDDSDQAKAALVAGCKKLLADHEGTAFFAVGTLSDLDREVNDRGFDVALHLVFANRAAHDRYQTAPKHNEFVAKFKENWSKVRVFDSDVEGAGSKH